MGTRSEIEVTDVEHDPEMLTVQDGVRLVSTMSAWGMGEEIARLRNERTALTALLRDVDKALRAAGHAKSAHALAAEVEKVLTRPVAKVRAGSPWAGGGAS